jgi:hypothetical protein
MATYNYPKVNMKEIKRLLFFILPIIVLIAIGPLAMFYATLPQYLPLAILVLIIIILTGILLGIIIRPRSQIIIDNNELIFDRPGKPPTTISRTSITSISEELNVGITVEDVNSGSRIFIPNILDGYQTIRNELNVRHPILPPPSDERNPLWIVLTIITISTISAVGAFVFKIKILFYVFIASFLIIAITQIIATINHKPQSKPNKSASPVHRVILGLVILYFLYRIIVSFF